MGIDDTFEFTLFSKDYSKFKDYLLKGNFVCGKGIVKEKNWNNDSDTIALEFKLTEMMMLDEVLDNFVKSIVFHIKLDDIDDAFCEKMEKIIKKNKGKVQLITSVEDYVDDEKISIQMIAEKRVNPSTILKELKNIDKILGIEIR